MAVEMSTHIPVNIYRAEDRLMVAAVLPGLQPADISVEVLADRRLMLEAKLRGRLKDWKDVLHEEWQAGGASREVALPDPVDANAGRATYENGILVVVLPLADSHRPGAVAPSAPAEAAGHDDARRP
jgi:HSP20 family protein